MKLGRMVRIDHMNKFSPVAKMNYGYVGQRSRSKSLEVEKVGHIEKTFKTWHVWYQIERFHLCNPSRHAIRVSEVSRSKFTLKIGQMSYLYDFVLAKMTSTMTIFALIKPTIYLKKTKMLVCYCLTMWFHK